MDYVAAYHMEHLLASCVDEVCGHQIPIRAMQLRTMLLETNRMMSHMICVGAQLSDVGAVNELIQGVV